MNCGSVSVERVVLVFPLRPEPRDGGLRKNAAKRVPSALRRANRLVTGWWSRYTAGAVVERSAEQICASGPSLCSPDGT